MAAALSIVLGRLRLRAIKIKHENMASNYSFVNPTPTRFSTRRRIQSVRIGQWRRRKQGINSFYETINSLGPSRAMRGRLRP